MNLSVLKRSLTRHLKISNYRPYMRVLESVASHGDVWMASQGAYMAWWHKRSKASLEITVRDGEMEIHSDLADVVLEKLPREFLTSNKTDCKESTFSGKLKLVIDETLERKHLLIDALQREGILNFTVGREGEFLLSHELDPLLERMEDHARKHELIAYDQAILDVRDAAGALFAGRGLPLVRIWYHPRKGDKVIRAVFSTRYDVDRAIANMPKILRLEREYHASSTAHVRVVHPFYTDAEIIQLDKSLRPAEIALHAEFSRHAQIYGSDVAAGQASKAHLEKVIGRPVQGISIHGGELMYNKQNAWEAIDGCDFLYAVAGPCPYWFPYRRVAEDGQFQHTYYLGAQVSDIRAASLSYDRFEDALYQEAMHCLESALEHNGVLVMLLHPEYFGHLRRLLDLKGIFRVLRFVPTYLGTVLKLSENQENINVPEKQRSQKSPAAT